MKPRRAAVAAAVASAAAAASSSLSACLVGQTAGDLRHRPKAMRNLNPPFPLVFLPPLLHLLLSALSAILSESLSIACSRCRRQRQRRCL